MRSLHYSIHPWKVTMRMVPCLVVQGEYLAFIVVARLRSVPRIRLTQEILSLLLAPSVLASTVCWKRPQPLSAALRIAAVLSLPLMRVPMFTSVQRKLPRTSSRHRKQSSYARRSIEDGEEMTRTMTLSRTLTVDETSFFFFTLVTLIFGRVIFSPPSITSFRGGL